VEKQQLPSFIGFGLRKFNTEPSIGASHQILVHFGKAVSDKKIFRN
jgi:hypothetical protein